MSSEGRRLQGDLSVEDLGSVQRLAKHYQRLGEVPCRLLKKALMDIFKEVNTCTPFPCVEAYVFPSACPVRMWVPRVFEIPALANVGRREFFCIAKDMLRVDLEPAYAESENCRIPSEEVRRAIQHHLRLEWPSTTRYFGIEYLLHRGPLPRYSPRSVQMSDLGWDALLQWLDNVAARRRVLACVEEQRRQVERMCAIRIETRQTALFSGGGDE